MDVKKVDKRTLMTDERSELLKVARKRLKENRCRKRAIRDMTDTKQFLLALRDLIDEHVKKSEDAISRVKCGTMDNEKSASPDA